MKKDLLLLHGAIGASDQFDPILPETKHPFEQIDYKLITTHLIKFFNN